MITAAHRPRRDDVLLIREDGATFAVPLGEADRIAAALRRAARTPQDGTRA